MASKKSLKVDKKASKTASAKTKTVKKPAKAEKPKTKAPSKKAEKKVAKAVAPKALSAQKPSAMSKAAKAKNIAKKAPSVVIEEGANADWAALANKNRDVRPTPYDLSGDYPAKTVLQHKVLGLGFVIKSINNRIEVLFKDGPKTLISNYKK